MFVLVFLIVFVVFIVFVNSVVIVWWCVVVLLIVFLVLFDCVFVWMMCVIVFECDDVCWCFDVVWWIVGVVEVLVNGVKVCMIMFLCELVVCGVLWCVVMDVVIMWGWWWEIFAMCVILFSLVESRSGAKARAKCDGMMNVLVRGVCVLVLMFLSY